MLHESERLTVSVNVAYTVAAKRQFTWSTTSQNGSQLGMPHPFHVAPAGQFEVFEPHPSDAMTSFTARSTLL
jgi:hypothetical protein